MHYEFTEKNCYSCGRQNLILVRENNLFLETTICSNPQCSFYINLRLVKGWEKRKELLK